MPSGLMTTGLALTALWTVMWAAAWTMVGAGASCVLAPLLLLTVWVGSTFTVADCVKLTCLGFPGAPRGTNAALAFTATIRTEGLFGPSAPGTVPLAPITHVTVFVTTFVTEHSGDELPGMKTCPFVPSGIV